MKKLKTVKVSFEFVILVDNDCIEEKEILKYSSYALSDTPSQYVECAILDYETPPNGWDIDCYPYNNEGKKIKEYLGNEK